MDNTRKLHGLGQSLWLDNITRTMLADGTLERYVREYSVTGLTSNPTIFDEAIGKSDAYDSAIRDKVRRGLSGKALFVELALEDLRGAADQFRPVWRETGGIDGYVSMEVSPLLASDTEGTIRAAADIHRRAERANLLVKIPGTPAGIPAIEASIFAGIPVNVTLLFSTEQYLAAAGAYMRGIERRLAAGLDARVASVASVFISRWDKAVSDRVPAELRNQLGVAVGRKTYRAYRELLASDRWSALAANGANAQRLLWASTGTKDPAAPDTLYVEALAAPDTINTMPEKTLLAFADHGHVPAPIAPDGGDYARQLDRYRAAGIDLDALGQQLQRDGAAAFVASWNGLMGQIARKGAIPGKAVNA